MQPWRRHGIDCWTPWTPHPSLQSLELSDCTVSCAVDGVGSVERRSRSAVSQQWTVACTGVNYITTARHLCSVWMRSASSGGTRWLNNVTEDLPQSGRSWRASGELDDRCEGGGLQSCVLRAVHSHGAVCRTAAGDIRAYRLTGAGCRLSDGEYRIGHGVHQSYCPIPNITQYRRISPNTPIPVSFERYCTWCFSTCTCTCTMLYLTHLWLLYCWLSVKTVCVTYWKYQLRNGACIHGWKG